MPVKYITDISRIAAIPADVREKLKPVAQKYAFRVKFRQGGIPVATGVNRL